MPLVTYGELCDFLGIEFGTDRKYLEPLLAKTTALFEKACGRSSAPFTLTGLTARTEILRADPWSTMLSLDYPIATITSIAVGRDVAAPDETLLPADATSVVWLAGGRDITRTDGGYWGRTSPVWVKVVYDTQAYAPEDAKLAIERSIARLYNERGKEGFSQVTRGSRSWSMADPVSEADDTWREAVQNHSRGWVR